MRDQNFAIGVDIGATKIASVLVDGFGKILASDYRLTALPSDEDGILDRIAASIQSVMGIRNDISGIGIDVPGVVNPTRGAVENAVNLGWEGVALREEVKKRIYTDTPIYLERDTYAQTLGEYFYGSAQGAENYVYLGIGSGLGAGAMINGRLLEGNNRAALEIGHLGLTGLTRACACGKVGCAETLLSGSGMVKTYLSPDWEANLIPEAQGLLQLSPQDILVRAQKGEARAQKLVDEFGKYLGEVISDLLMILNPSLVVMGGGLGVPAFNQVESQMWDEIRRRSMPENYQKLSIVGSTLESSALGAASLVRYSQKLSL
mgnify:CR=1 FL=1